MALNWRLTDIENWQTVCYTEYEDGQYLEPMTNFLIFRTMVIGMNQITEKNHRDFWTRLAFYHRLFQPTGCDHPKLDDVIEHIGLWTNASCETDAKWYKRMTDNFRREAIGGQL